MTLPAVDMIRRLASGIRPDGGRPRAGVGAFESLGFGQLLESAARDVRPSGRPVRVASDLELELDDEESASLAHAMDRAEAKGIERLLAVTDRGLMVLDVHERVVRSLEEEPTDEVRAGIDGAVVLGGLGGRGESGSGERAEDLARGLRRIGSASLVRVLAEREE